MTLLQSGAEQMIADFGVYVKVYHQDSQTPDNPDDPVFFSENENSSNFEEYKVRLYTSNSDEIMQDYGFDESSDSLMYHPEDIADEGDTVEYPKGDYKWNIEEKSTNQINEKGPYIYVYAMGGT
jgi:hypothetical protein